MDCPRLEIASPVNWVTDANIITFPGENLHYHVVSIWLPMPEVKAVRRSFCCGLRLGFRLEAGCAEDDHPGECHIVHGCKAVTKKFTTTQVEEDCGKAIATEVRCSLI